MNYDSDICRYHLGASYGPRCNLTAGHAGDHDYGDPDRVDVPVNHAAWTITVRIEETVRNGNRETDVPTIAVTEDGKGHLALLTWAEARALAAALTEVTDIAENG